MNIETLQRKADEESKDTGITHYVWEFHGYRWVSEFQPAGEGATMLYAGQMNPEPELCHAE